jgi:hypothetical protein
VRAWSRHPLAHLAHAEHQSGRRHERAGAGRPIWLPQLHEPVTLVLASGETLPGRVTERSTDALVIAVIVPTGRLREAQLRSLALEYSNPGGRVRLAGRTSARMSSEGALVRIDEPRLLEVVQQRAHVRVQAECKIVLRTEARKPKEIQAHTLDVSAGGVLVAESNILEQDDEFAFELTLAKGAPPIAGHAQVARIDAQGRAGLYFSSISPADRWRLIRFTLDCQENEDFRHPAHSDTDGTEPPAQDR